MSLARLVETADNKGLIVNPYSERPPWPTVVAGAALISAIVAVATVNIDSAPQDDNTQNYLFSIGAYEQAGSARLHAELELFRKFDNVQR